MGAISDYFKCDKSLYPGSGLTFYVFDDTKKENFVVDCLVPFREAYIKEEQLAYIVSKYQTTREEEISGRLPGKGKVMSGDFGEILSFYLACQLWSPNVNVFPMKWRFKDPKKDASKYTDIVLFELKSLEKATVDDSMVTYEVKTRATALGNKPYAKHKRKSKKSYKDGKDECTILEAVVDANEDAVERAAETIPYLELRCKDLDLEELYWQIHRFSVANKVTYKKEHHAVAIVDKSLLAEQIKRMPADLLAQHPNVNNVYCLPITELQQLYERVYADMPKNS